MYDNWHKPQTKQIATMTTELKVFLRISNKTNKIKLTQKLSGGQGRKQAYSFCAYVERTALMALKLTHLQLVSTPLVDY